MENYIGPIPGMIKDGDDTYTDLLALLGMPDLTPMPIGDYNDGRNTPPVASIRIGNSEYSLKTVLAAVGASLAKSGAIGDSANVVYLDGNRATGYTADGSMAYPYRTIAAFLADHAEDTLPLVVYMAPATYLGGGDVTLPNVPITVYGNHSTISNAGHTITIPNAQFTRYDLFTVSDVVYATFLAGARCAMYGGGITGNITVHAYCEFVQCQLNGGIVTIGETGQCVLSICSPTSRFVSAGVLMFNGVNMNTGYAGYLINCSASGILTMVNTIVYNTSTNALAGAVSCDNAAAVAAPNSIVNCSLVTLGGAKCVNAGTAYTIYGKNNVSAAVDAAPVYGAYLIPVNTDILGGGTIMGLGADATGDLYYRAATTGLLTRLPIGTTGQVLKVVDGVPAWASA